MLTIYKASAGSGKTYTLTYEYIKMLLGVKDQQSGEYSLNRNPKMCDRHRHILAITFTNKSTDEMKQRIIHELAVLGGMERGWDRGSPYADRLCSELHCSPDELRIAASKALRQLLLDFNFFQVSTIDSFSQTVLRSFAREVDLTGNYEVDLDNDRAIAQGVRDLFESLQLNSGDPEIRRLVSWITQYLLSELKEGRQVMIFNRRSNVHANFLKFIKDISNDDFAAHYDELLEYLEDPDRLTELNKRLNELIAEEIRLIRGLCLKAVEEIDSRDLAPVPGGKGKANDRKVGKSLYDQLKLFALEGEKKECPKSIEKASVDVSEAYKKELRGQTDAALDSAIQEACRAVVDGLKHLRLYRAIRANLFVVGLIERVNAHIRSYRNENNTLYISDTNTILRQIIGDDAANAPFVYERLGVWLNHYLIDEFQDTSKIQWENLRPLLSEGQANGNDSLIIGDEKQCIYRFRNSDPTLLQSQVGVDFRRSSAVRGNSIEENTNWRSASDIVEFNNALFEKISSATGVTGIYSNVRQQVSPKHRDHHGYIKVTAIEGGKDDDLKTTALEAMTADIVRQLHAGYKPCDIAILTRFNADATAVIDHLMEAKMQLGSPLANINIVSDDAMLISVSPAVRLIVSHLRRMASPAAPVENTSRRASVRRDIQKMTNVYEYLCGQGKESSDALAEAISAVKSHQSADPFEDQRDRIEQSMANYNVPSLVEQIIAAYLSKDMADSENMYVSAFVDAVTDFCSQGNSDLQSFLSWWDDHGCHTKISAPFDENAVRVMTIHKSKGLEFKCVHVPFANWDMVRFMGVEWFETEGVELPGIDPGLVPPIIPLQPSSKLEDTPFRDAYLRRCAEQMLDEINVLYVALTRATNELMIVYNRPGSTDGLSSVSKLLDEILPLDGMIPDAGGADEQGDDESEGARLSILTVGSPTVPGRDEAKARTTLEPTEASPMSAYRSLPREDLWAKFTVESRGETARNEGAEEARHRGTMLHELLSKISHADDLDGVIDRMVGAGMLFAGEADEIRSRLRDAFRRPEIARWFVNHRHSMRERSIHVPDRSEIRIPDRVVETADGYIDVVDFKFGKEDAKKYSEQVRDYMELLRRMGYERVRGFLWYVTLGKVQEIE